MIRARRAATVVALALLVPLTPLLISLTMEEPVAEGRKPPKPPERREAAPEGPRARGTVKIRLLGVNDLHGYLGRTGESPGAAYLAAHLDRYERQNTIRVHALAHSGAGDTDLGGTADEIFTETKQMDDAVDAVFSGHTHNRLDRRVAGKPVVQAEQYETHFSVVDLSVDRASGEVTKSEARVVSARDGEVRPDPKVAKLVEGYAAEVAPISDRVLGIAGEGISPSPTAAGESALGDFVADGQRSLAGTDFALVPTGGLRTNVTPGPVTYGELFSVQPSGRDLIGRDLIGMELSGEEVRRALEAQYRPAGTTFSPSAASATPSTRRGPRGNA